MKVSKEKAAENRELILNQAAKLFRERGISGVGVDALAEAAGLTHGSLYNQFGSKDKVLSESLNHGFSRTRERASGITSISETFAVYAGAVICFGGLIFAGIRMMSGRFQFNTANPELRIRAGSLATVEKFGEDNAITVRLDNGKTVELDGEQSRYIDYGYAAETAKQASVDRILVTGNFNQIAEQQEALTHLSPHLRDLAIYTSHESGQVLQQIASSANSKPISVPTLPEIELEGVGLGL
jgi:AcrR family transcriptional regulator